MEKYKSITDYYDVRSAITYAEKRASEKAEEKRNKTFAQNCAMSGMPIEEIARLTDLSVGRVVNLLQNTQ